MTKDLVCIVCPNGCRIRATYPDGRQPKPEEIEVSGNRCARGVEYARQELTSPRRVLTSTVKLSGSRHTRLPVKTNRSIPKTQLFEVMKLLDDVEVKAPVHTGDVILQNVSGTGADIVATRDIE